MTDVINTTAGQMNTADLGRTLMHEHVLVGFPGWYLDNRQPEFKRAEVMPRVIDAFQQLHAYGVRTVVDPCPMDMGRQVDICAEVAQKSGINIVCTTGAYYEDAGLTFTFRHLPVEAITEIYVKEIEDGIGYSGIKAGLIKISTGEGRVSDYERKLLTAAGQAARITGVPLISHTEKCTCGHDQIDIITAQGVPSCQLMVGHSDGRDDPEYQASLAARGSYVGFDRFGLVDIVPDEVRMKNVKTLVEGGHRDRLMLSHDKVNCFLGTLPGGVQIDAFEKIIPNWKMTHLFENIFPELLRMGVSQADLDHIVTENPRRFFTEARASAAQAAE
ncbi:phosphotriesterase family protein [Zavarzinia sp. CC-PAN008]|uniref:phosphotriesterase family protein n=1 Tax=Zavarzinia sp. CC-PAN008 TaxID=3243332 RepID=UPI003F746319